jgi:hypothetical protein
MDGHPGLSAEIRLDESELNGQSLLHHLPPTTFVGADAPQSAGEAQGGDLLLTHLKKQPC